MDTPKGPARVHVAIGGILGGALSGVVSPVIATVDNVLMGPSSVDPKRHYAARPSVPNLYDAIAQNPGPLCIYRPLSPLGLLTWCQICAIALEHKREMFVVDVDARARPPTNDIDPGRVGNPDVTGLDPSRLSPCPIPALETALAATLWNAWCHRSPTGVSKFCAAGSTQHALLRDLGHYHAGLFPRLTPQGLHLSRLDDLLLRELSREWVTSSQVFVQAMTRPGGLDAWLSHVGDGYVTFRLLAFSRHSQGRIVERRQEKAPNPADPKTWAFRWSTGGEAILGVLPSLDAAPRLRVGGAAAYDPARPWVCRMGARGPYVSPGGGRSVD